MRAKAVGFERGKDPKEAMGIGLIKGGELINELYLKLWPDVKYERYSREAGTPTTEDVYEWIYHLMENYPLEEIQPENITVQDFADYWDMY